MSAAVCYFLVYFAEALILLQYSSNVFEYKISSIKRYILLTVLFIPIYFISFAHIGLLNTALFFCCYFLFFLKNFQPWKINVQLSFSILAIMIEL